MKLYTKVGDHGATKQINGKKGAKVFSQIVALGDLDELDSWLGYVASQAKATPDFDWLAEDLEARQRELYELLADVAVPRHQTITADHVQGLETAIDKMMAAVPKIPQPLCYLAAIRWQLLCNMAEQWLAAPSDHWINWTLRVNRLSR